VGGVRPALGVEVIEVPARVGAGLKKQSHPLGVVAADRGGERHPGDLADIRWAAEQQSQALVIFAEPSQVKVVVIGHRAPVEQQPGDPGIGGAGDGATQRLPAAAGDHAVGICPGVEQQPRHRDEPVLPAGVEAIPLRRAGRMQRGPSGRWVGASRHARVSFDSGPHPVDVAEHHRCRQVVASEFRSRLKHPGRSAGPVADAGHAELVGELGQLGAAGLNFGLELCPASEAVLTRHRELRGS